MKLRFLTVLSASLMILGLSACASSPATGSSDNSPVFKKTDSGVEVAIYEMPSVPAVNTKGTLVEKQFPTGLDLALGSGLEFVKVDQDGSLVFLGISDRGPNLDSPAFNLEGKVSPTKVFPVPSFVPTYGYIRVGAKGLGIEKTVELKDPTGKLISGFPLPVGSIGSTNEVAFDLNLNVLGNDAQGLDTEAIRFDTKNKNYVWICDEYGPFIAKVEVASGKIVEKYGPGSGLPDLIALRQANRGAEGLAVTPNGKIYVAVQSILDIDGKVKSSKAPFMRIVEFDPMTKAVRQFAYPHDVSTYKRSADAKLGDLLALNDTNFLLIEQAKGADGKMRNLIYNIDISGASDISGKKTAEGKELEALASLGDFEALGFKAVQKKLVFDLRAYGWKVEKAEGLALVDSRTLAVISDNDFGLSVELENPAEGKTEVGDYEINGKNLTLGGKAVSTKLQAGKNNEAGQLWLVRFPTDIVSIK